MGQELKTWLEKFAPLIGVFSFVVTATVMTSYFTGQYGLMAVGQVFMGFFFLTFGSFKIYNLEGFREAFVEYDPLAQRYELYSAAYPFIELGLGLLYLVLTFANYPGLQLPVYALTVVVMTVNGSGVLHALLHGRKLQCACLGNVFKVPMTKVTLVEDLLMAIMALLMTLFVI